MLIRKLWIFKLLINITAFAVSIQQSLSLFERDCLYFTTYIVTSSRILKKFVSRSFWSENKIYASIHCSRYFFLRYAMKNTRTDETVFVSCKQDVTSSDFCKKSYREVFDGKTDFVFQFTGSRYIFLRCAKKNTWTDETVFVSCKQGVTSSDFCKKTVLRSFWLEDKICASVHWFSIHFSTLRYEKHSNWRNRFRIV